MTRHFLLFYALIIASIVAAIISLNLFANYLTNRIEKDSYTEMYTAPFTMLDASIIDLQGEKLEEGLSRIRTLFKYPVDLLSSDEVTLTDEEKAEIEKGAVIGKDIAGSHNLFRKSIVDGKLWNYIVQLGEYENEVAVATGPLVLLRDELIKLGKPERETALTQKTKETGYLFEINNPETFSLGADEITRLEKGLVIVRNPGKPGEQFLVQLDNSNEILRTTVAGYPWYAEYLIILVFSCGLLALALFSMLWLYPLWRDLNSLKKASNDISRGMLSARAGSGRPSMIKSVLHSFDAMAESSQKMIASQKELTDAVSHELRTPLARMKFDLEMLEESKHPQDQRRHIDDIRVDIDELNGLVDELLNFAREDNHSLSGKLEEFTPEKMKLWLQNQLDLAGRGHTELKLHFEYNCDIPVVFNSKSMSHAVSNGLQNGIRFANSQIILCFINRNGEYQLSIEDDGPGIPLQARNEIFQPFKRADSSRNKGTGGYGLGLAIVKRIAETHKGSARIEDASLGGNRLMIRWPVQNPS